MTTTLEYARPNVRASRGASLAGWIIGGLPALLMLLGSGVALTRSQGAIDGFQKFGYPASMLLPVGIAELCCAIRYLVPQTAVLGAILLTAYLGGAVATHARMSDPLFVVPVIVAILLWVGLLLRDRRLRAVLPLRSEL